jgi:hypothetical protein
MAWSTSSVRILRGPSSNAIQKHWQVAMNICSHRVYRTFDGGSRAVHHQALSPRRVAATTAARTLDRTGAGQRGGYGYADKRTRW